MNTVSGLFPINVNVGAVVSWMVVVTVDVAELNDGSVAMYVTLCNPRTLVSIEPESTAQLSTYAGSLSVAVQPSVYASTFVNSKGSVIGFGVIIGSLLSFVVTYTTVLLLREPIWTSCILYPYV